MKVKPFYLERKDGVVRMPPGVHEFADHLVLEASLRGVKVTIYRRGGKAAGGWRSNREEVMEEVDTWCGADAGDEIRKAVDNWMAKAAEALDPDKDPANSGADGDQVGTAPAPIGTGGNGAAKKAAAKGAAKKAGAA